MIPPSTRFVLTVQSSHEPAYLKQLLMSRLNAVWSDVGSFTLDIAPDTKWLPQPKPVPAEVSRIFELLDNQVELLIIHARGYALLSQRGDAVSPVLTGVHYEELGSLVCSLQAGDVPAVYARPALVLDDQQRKVVTGIATVATAFEKTGLLELFRKDPGKADAARNLDLALKAFLKEVK